MSDLNPCDVCGKPGRRAMVVTGCSEHKTALKAAVENCNNNQQLKAEIAVDLLRGIMARTLFSAESQANIVSEFQRQLSAV